jgi:membrane-bound serine protease (ClpP class)
LALGLFVLEAKFPTHGVLGVGGVVSLVLGALMLIRTPLTGMGVSLSTALGVAIPFAVIVVVLMRLVLRSRSWRPSTGKEELVGAEGEVREPVGSAGALGSVFIHGELWRASTHNGQSIPPGARVRVNGVEGLTLEVEPVKLPPSSA